MRSDRLLTPDERGRIIWKPKGEGEHVMVGERSGLIPIKSIGDGIIMLAGLRLTGFELVISGEIQVFEDFCHIRSN